MPNTVYFDTARFCFIEYDEGNILHIWFDDFEMQLSSIHVSIMKDFLEFFLEALWRDSMLYSKYNPVCSNKL